MFYVNATLEIRINKGMSGTRVYYNLYKAVEYRDRTFYDLRGIRDLLGLYRVYASRDFRFRPISLSWSSVGL